jgi:hypothetical protein
MCDYYSVTYGYICSDCLEELKLGGRQDIATFMGLRKPRQSLQEQEHWEAEVDEEFKSRHEDE